MANPRRRVFARVLTRSHFCVAHSRTRQQSASELSPVTLWILLGGEEKSGIYTRIVEVNTPVQMGACDTPGLADAADPLTRANLPAHINIDRIHVAIQANEPVAVVEDDGVAIEKIVPRCAHHACGWGDDGGPFVSSDIHARMRRAGLAVEEAF